jgi:GH25 family lysozyme M1 (1,4-beta-N-acetylmuramidase)
MALPFIDVGDSQGSVDWDRASTVGKTAIASCKTTEGADFRASTFSRARVKAIHKAGLPLMPYHYLRPRTDRRGSAEAEFALAVLDDAGWKPRSKRFKRGPDLPLVMDIEQHLNEQMLAKMSGTQVLHYAEEFAGTVFERFGRGVMTYVSPGFMPEMGSRAPAHAEDVWVAAFSFGRGKPPTPGGFKKDRVRAHQFSDHGTFPGVSTTVDLDVWMGTHKSLEAFIEGSPVTPATADAGSVSPEPTMSTKDVQSLLKQIGFPLTVDGARGAKTAQAIKAFQRGYLGAPPVAPLLEDGLVGPKSEQAMRDSAENGGACSKHFKFKEFASSHTGAILTHRELVVGLEKLRAHVGHPIGILSGFRDFDLGASMSQHKFGNAIDPTVPLSTVAEVAALKVFSGIGHSPGSDRVRHLDVRHVGPNTTNSSKSRPEIFVDAF